MAAASSPGHPPISPADAVRARRVRAGVLAEHGYDVPCVWLLEAHGPGPVLEWPLAAELLYGHPAGEVIGRPRSALLVSEPRHTPWEDVEQALREHGRWEGEVLHVTRDGRRVLTESRLVLVDEFTGRPSQAGDPTTPGAPRPAPLVVEIARDVTGQRVAEEALRASQDRLAAIIESALDAIVTTDAAGRVVLFNAAAERLFGVRTTAAIGEPLARFLRDPARATHPGTALGVHGDGREFPVEAATSHVDTAEGRLSTVIVRDVTERLRAEAEREQLIDALERERARLAESARHADAARAEADAARQEAEAASQAKSAFLATMSHELRTPLNAVLGYVDLLDLGIAGDVTEAQRAYIDRIGASGRHLLGLINDVLDLAKIEAGQMIVQRQPYAARGAVRAALSVVRPHAAARGLTLEEGYGDDAAGTDPAGPTYVGDERRVEQILVNLLSNAVKFTASGGRVHVECATTREPPPGRTAGAGRGAWVTVRVSDTGVGIAPEQHEMVFARFHQVDEGAAGPYRRTQGGTGLGLAISRELARLMGGDLTVESAAGSGSVFTLWLPAAAPAIAGARGAGGGAADVAPAPKLAIGALLAAAVPAVVAAWVQRLRADPLVPHARGLARAELEDHLPSYVADFAQQFVIFDDPSAGHARVGLVRDGAAVRHLIARQHGAQRAQLGWDEAALAREFAVLGEELERALAAGLADVPPGTVDDARELVRAWLADAVRESAAALRTARPGGVPPNELAPNRSSPNELAPNGPSPDTAVPAA